MKPQRDRDPAGRPRNARPRDALGRPLPRGSDAGVERVPDRLDLPLDDAIELAQRYLGTGRPFHSHEVLEALWKSRPAGERDLWQGLAQIAVGLTHAQRDNRTGAIALLERGADRVGHYAGDPHGIDVREVLSHTQANIAALRAGGKIHDATLKLKSAAGQDSSSDSCPDPSPDSCPDPSPDSW
jgi:predicted metal-dependent hydrolase